MTGNDILQIRKSLRLSMRQFAAVIDTSHSIVSEWESGRHHITSDMESHVKSRLEDYCKLQIHTIADVLELYTNCTDCTRIKGVFA